MGFITKTIYISPDGEILDYEKIKYENNDYKILSKNTKQEQNTWVTTIVKLVTKSKQTKLNFE